MLKYAVMRFQNKFHTFRYTLSLNVVNISD